MSSTEKIINLDLLAFYDGKIKEYIDGKTTNGKGIAIQHKGDTTQLNTIKILN